MSAQDRQDRIRAFQRWINVAWAADIVVVCAAGNDGLDRVTLDQTIPQLYGTSTNPMMTVGGTYPDGTLWYQTNPFNPPNGYVPPALTPPNARFGQLLGGSITAYAQAYKVVTSATSAASDDPETETGTSLASPQVVRPDKSM